LLLHEVSTWGEGMQRGSDLKDEAKEIDVLLEMIIKILSKRCNKSHEEVRKLIERKEVWFSAKEALEWGLVDRII
jgi:ATP-dependent protease ClpP protease subunit